jgi:carboxyl-terminal processing protease
MEEIKNNKGQIRLPLIIALAISIGLVIGTLIVNPKVPVAPESSKAVAKFREVITNIDQSYVDSVNSSELVDMAIVNLLEELDPHTSYISAEELSLSNMHLKGGYDGIGIQFDIIQDSIVVVKPSANGPAARAGIILGDRIIKVEDENVAGIDLENRDVTHRLLGKEGTL